MRRTTPIALALLAAAALGTALPACGPAAAVKTPAPEKETVRKAPNQPKPAETNGKDQQAHALMWKQNIPATVQISVTEGATPSSAPSFSYKPDPPDVQMELAAGPGTLNFTLAAIELTWEWSLPSTGQDEPVVEKRGPTKLPITPVNVFGAPTDQPGEPFRVRVPLDVMTLKDPFTTTEPGKRISDATAYVSFYDSKDEKVFANQTAIALRVPIRVTLK